MLFQTGSAATGAPFAECEYLDWGAQITLGNGLFLAQGQVVCRDITQIVGIAGQVGTSSTSSQTDQVVLPASANAGRNYGAYQGPTIINATGQSAKYLLSFRQKGIGLVLATAAASGTAVTVGATLISQPTTSSQVIVGAFATGKTVGMVVATPINTSAAASISAGTAQVVTPGSIIGITTTTPLVIDNSQSGVQETVTPTAVTQGVPASTTETIVVVSALAGVTITTTIAGTFGGVAVSFINVYATVSGDTTATATAGHMVTAINAQLATSPASQYLAPVTNAAGVITWSALQPGTGGNTLTIASVVSSGGTNYTAAVVSPFANGANGTFTATFVNNHGANAPITGAATAVGASLIPVPSTFSTSGLVVADVAI